MSQLQTNIQLPEAVTKPAVPEANLPDGTILRMDVNRTDGDDWEIAIVVFPRNADTGEEDRTKTVRVEIHQAKVVAAERAAQGKTTVAAAIQTIQAAVGEIITEAGLVPTDPETVIEIKPSE